MTRVAAIDCGTNSLRLLITEDGRDLVREMRIVRLGQGVDRTGRLAPEALDRTRAGLVEYAGLIRRFGAQRTRFVATSATRDADNRAEFVAMVQATLGVEPEVVSGSAEAELSFVGAIGSVPGLSGAIGVVDLGGGSTELVVGAADGFGPLRARSMDVGSVRMTERHLVDDPPTPAEVAAVVADVDAAITDAERDVPLREVTALIGVAGSITTIAAIGLGLDHYDSAAIHGSRLSATQIAEITARLVSLDHAGRAAIRVIHPGRVDVITAGAIVLRTVVERAGVAELTVSEHDILDGIALSIS